LINLKEMHMSRSIGAAVIVAAALSGPTWAQDKMKMEGHDMSGSAMPAASAAAQMSQGEVRKVDKDAQKITIKHGPIDNLGMPPMTMVFRVKDPAMLDQVKPGDKVRFSADKVGGAYTVMNMEPAK
jgi:Cu/Ag efflux protein CusF